MTPDLFSLPEPKAKRGSRMPADWKPSPEARKFAEDMGMEVDKTAAEFRDYWLGNGKVMVDWLATWRNWCRRTDQFARKPLFKSRFEEKETKAPPATEWGPRLRGYKPGGFWSPMWGFRPETGMCGAPKADIERWKAGLASG